MDIENKMSDIQKGYNVESEVEYLKSRVKKLEDENIRLKRLLNEAGISYECSCNQIPDILHTVIQLRALSCAVVEFILQIFDMIFGNIFFVAHLVLQPRPEIHRDRTELHFHRHRFFLILQENGNLYNQMETSVTAWFRILDIVFAFLQRNIILSQKAVCHFINIGREGTDDPHTGDICDVFLNGFQCHRNIFSTDLL